MSNYIRDRFQHPITIFKLINHCLEPFRLFRKIRYELGLVSTNSQQKLQFLKKSLELQGLLSHKTSQNLVFFYFLVSRTFTVMKESLAIFEIWSLLNLGLLLRLEFGYLFLIPHLSDLKPKMLSSVDICRCMSRKLSFLCFSQFRGHPKIT